MTRIMISEEKVNANWSSFTAVEVASMENVSFYSFTIVQIRSMKDALIFFWVEKGYRGMKLMTLKQKTNRRTSALIADNL